MRRAARLAVLVHVLLAALAAPPGLAAQAPPDKPEKQAERARARGEDEPSLAEDLQEEEEEEPPPAEPGLFEQWLRLGQLEVRERLAWHYRRLTSRGFSEPSAPLLTVPRRTERDQELRDVFDIETHGLGHEQIHSYLNFEYRKDLDGTSDPSFHKNIVTAARGRQLLRLHSFYVEALDVADHLQVRVGRQSVVEAHPVVLDGVWTRLDRFRLLRMPAEVRAFGGRLVSDFSNLRQDGVFGGGLTVHPAPRLALEVRDTRYVRNRLEAEARWQPLPAVSLVGMYGFFEAKRRDARGEVAWSLLDLGTEVTAGYYERFSHDFRLDFMTGQSSRRFAERRLLLPRLAPFREAYVRLHQALGRWLAAGGEFLNHALRNGGDESRFDTDYRRLAAYLDWGLGPARLRTEFRYYHADRHAFTLRVPQTLPQQSVLTDVKQGERDHLEYHLNGEVNIGRGFGIDSGLVWHRVNQVDALAAVEHERALDFRLALRARVRRGVTLRMVYETTRDMDFFYPYVARFQALSWILDVEL